MLSTVSQLGSGTRAIGVYPQRWATPTGPLCVALWGVNDPGNVGTVIRSALAFGANSVVVGPGSADPVRAEGRPRLDGRDLLRPRRARTRCDRRCRAAGSRSSPARASRSRALDGEVTFVVGAEREGLPADVIASCDDVAHIPIAHADSLNAAMAATVSLYELTRITRP